MPDEPESTSGLASVESWRRVLAEGRRHAPRLIAASLLARLLIAAVFGPLAALALHLGIALAGEGVVTDFGVVSLASSPVGLIGVVAATVVGVSGWVLELVAMAAIVRGGADSAWSAVRRALVATPTTSRVVTRVLVDVVRWVAPALAVIGAIYAVLLSRYDINFYLATKPPVFWVAVTLAAVAAGWAVWGLGRVASRWLASPASIADGVDAAEVFDRVVPLAESTRGRKVAVAQWLIASLAAPSVFAALGAACWALAAPWWPRSLIAIATGVGLWLVVGGVVSWLCSAASTAALACLSSAAVGAPASETVTRTDATLRGLLTRRRVIVSMLLAIGLSAAAGFYALLRIEPGGDVAVIAHRGAAKVAPENTLAAVRAAIDAGADWVEIDVQETSDGEVVVFHDSDFMKAAGVATKVWDVTTDELAGIDVGARFGPDFAGERVPTLAEVLEVCRDRVGLLIELKYYGHDVDLENRVVERVEAAGVVDQTRFMSLKREGVARLKALRPDWNVGLLLSVYVGRSSQLEADFLAMNASFIGPQTIEAARQDGREVYAWTVNEPASMASLATAGVAGLITDDPALARETLSEWRTLSPLARLLVHVAGRFTPAVTGASP